MLSPTQISSLLIPYKNAPRGTIPFHPADPALQIVPRGTIRPRRTRPAHETPLQGISQSQPGFQAGQSVPRETKRPERRELHPPNAPRGTIQVEAIEPAEPNAPRGTFGDRDWPRIYDQLATYLELLLKWNARTNLTAIRDPQEIVRRHFGESLFTGLALAHNALIQPGATVLDFGSGAGFPGLPIQILYPELHVALAESQGKKAAFLREAIRTLGLKAEVWAGRTETMAPERRFNLVTLRAVDNMDAALAEAGRRAGSDLAILTTRAQATRLPLPGLHVTHTPIPASDDRILLLASR